MPQSPTRHLYALLVAINKYQSPVRPLGGCLHDLKEMEKYLLEEEPHFKVHIETLINDEAGKDIIVQRFKEHLTQAGEDDVALFYFSGHGTQEKADVELWKYESDKKLEALVCYDSVERGRKEYRFLADKELRYLIHEVAQKNPHILTIFDCCHSGDNSREETVLTVEQEARARRYMPANRSGQAFPVRTWKDFIFSEKWTEEEFKKQELKDLLPEGKHIQLAACQSDQSAYEVKGSGIFTRFLLEVLRRSDRAVNYYDLRSRVKNYIKNRLNQTPQIYVQGSNGHDIFRTFLNKGRQGKPLYGNVQFNGKLGWMMDLGALHGLSPLTEKVNLVVDDNTMLETNVAEVEAEYTLLAPPNNEAAGLLRQNEVYKGFVEDAFVAPLSIYIHADSGQEGRKQDLQDLIGEIVPSILLTHSAANADYALTLKNGKFQITPPEDLNRPLVLPTPDQSPQSAELICQYLDYISCWAYVKNLHNSTPGIFRNKHPVKLEVFRITDEGEEIPIPITGEDEILHHYEMDDFGQPGGRIRIKITNTHFAKIYCALLYLDLNFQVYTRMLRAGVQGLEEGEVIWAYDGNEIELALEEEVSHFNLKHSLTYFKLIVNTRDFDVSIFEQEPLPSPIAAVRREQDKGIIPREPEKTEVHDWTTRLFQLKLPHPNYRE